MHIFSFLLLVTFISYVICASLDVFTSSNDIKEGDNLTLITKVLFLSNEKIFGLKWWHKNEYIAIYLEYSKELNISKEGKSLFADRISASFSDTEYLIQFTNLLVNDSITLKVKLTYQINDNFFLYELAKNITIDVYADPVILSFPDMMIKDGDTLFVESTVYGKPKPSCNIVFKNRVFDFYNYTEISHYTYKHVYNMGVLTADDCGSILHLSVSGNRKIVSQNATVQVLFTPEIVSLSTLVIYSKDSEVFLKWNSISSGKCFVTYNLFFYNNNDDIVFESPGINETQFLGFNNGNATYLKLYAVFNVRNYTEFSGSPLKVDIPAPQDSTNKYSVVHYPGCCSNTTFGEKSYKGEYTFEFTCHDQYVMKNCIYGEGFAKSRCTLKDDMYHTWEYPDLSECEPKSPTTKMLEEISKKLICDGISTDINICQYVNVISKNLSDTVASGSVLTTYHDVNFIAIILKNVARVFPNATGASDQVFVDILQTINNVLDTNKVYIAESQLKNYSSTSIMNTLGQFASFYTDQDIPISVNKSNIGFHAERVNKGNITLTAQKLQNNFSGITFNNGSDLNKDTYAVIQLPSEVFVNESEVIHSYFFRKHYFLLDENSLSNFVGENNWNETLIQSAVLSASIGNRSVSNLSKPIILTFQKIHYSDFYGDNTCGYWNESTETTTGNWLTNGCYKYEAGINSEKYFTCACDHLTNFALLLNINQRYVNPLVLSIVTYIGCGISLIGLSLTLLTLGLFRNLRKKLAHKILACLCISLMGLLISFLIGAKQTKPEIMCTVFAAVIHYFMLTTFCWMLVEGVNMYCSFVLVFKDRDDDSFLRNASIFAWGLPVAIVVTNGVLVPKSLGDNDVCVVHGNSFGFAVIIPVCLTLLVNFVVLLAIMYSLSNRVNTSVQVTTRQFYLSQVKVGFACSALLGSSWLFAVLAIGDLSPVFQWLFCIFTSLQGFFIFVFYILRNKEVVVEWKLFIRRYRPKYISSTSGNNETNLMLSDR